MLIEAAQLKGLPVKLATGKKIAAIDVIVFDGDQVRLAGWQTIQKGVMKRFHALSFEDTLSVGREGVVVDNEAVLKKDLQQLDAWQKQWGKLLNVKAKTESGKVLGKVYDILIEAETGYVVRFYIRQLIQERIIPRKYLAAITPKAVIFQDVVDAPIFDSLATSDASVAL